MATNSKLSSANSLSDLLRALDRDARLGRQMSSVIGELTTLTPTQREGLQHALVSQPPLTLGAWLARKDLHKHPLAPPYPAVLAALKSWLLSDTAIEGALDDADAFSDLASIIEGHALARRPLIDLVGSLDCPTALRLKLLRLADGPRLTLGAFLETADDRRWTDEEFFQVLDAFRAFIADELDLAGVARKVRVPPTTTSLVARIAALPFPDLGDWTEAMIGGRDWAGARLDFIARHGDLEGLDRTLDAFEARLPTLRALSFPTVVPSELAPLAAAQAAALAERRRIYPDFPLEFLAVRFSLSAEGPDLCVDVDVRGAASHETVTCPRFSTWARSPVTRCSCKRERCLHRALVLERLAFGWPKSKEPLAVLRAALLPRWERVLDSLGAPSNLTSRQKPGVLSFRVGAGCELSLHELGKRGPSAKGKRTSAEAVLDRVEGLDLRIAERLALARPAPRGEGGGMSRHFGDGLLLLVGHPRVSWQDEPAPAPVREVDATVCIDEREGGFALRFSLGAQPWNPLMPVFRCTGGVMTFARAPDAILVARLSEEFLRLSTHVAREGGELPREAAPRLVELLPKLEAVAVVELPDELRGDERAPTERLVVQVTTSGEGLSLAIRVEPLEKGPVFVPGQGVPVSAVFDGRRRAFTRRRFERELAEANALAGALGLDPAMADPPYAWQLDATDKHVETLRRLEGRDVAVEWKAPRVKFTSEAQLGRVKLRIERKKDWFGLEGEATVDGRRVSLAALLEAARARRRFVKLGDGDFAQLSEALLDALRPLAHLSAPGAATQLTLGAAPLIEALAPQLEGLDAAKEWSVLMKRLAEAKQARFAVPPTLKAMLRDYQVEGFEWLSRLAQWGVGACLADDMGLGKTLQALTLLLSRAAQGPALVVAPSSVLHTWRAEAAKFAPSLKLALFHEGDRALGKLGPGDVVVVSWSLFAREAAAFSKVRLATAVLDEAQAIKNAGTQRAKAAHGLEADFVVALSGTPVENHVGELWSLFKAVMPTLLGSEESFRARFGAGDKDALSALATLVRPYILRRTKGAVAKELPPRTDLELVIPLSAEERALYDDVRLSAVTDLGEVTGESKRFDVLAALTRLRLTACHPRLVDASWAGPTSKLTRLLELVKDLSSAGHRVLVFSQFTQHLALVVEALRTEGVTFSYLDGQVPLTERQRRVDAFQQGAGGDVFLVSLKAGGTGLTLTAADYVIHLDPWWNPAVEDQASDRAHRIGQARPVTVYRLIAEGTIEQQILSLHRDKRELVDALLEGADTAGKLSTTQLAQLITGHLPLPVGRGSG